LAFIELGFGMVVRRAIVVVDDYKKVRKKQTQTIPYNQFIDRSLTVR
jgi:hypothetical protein